MGRVRSRKPLRSALGALPIKRFAGLLMRFLPVASRRFDVTLLHEELLPGGSVPAIRHRRTDEVVFVLEGRASAYLDGRRVPLRAGSLLEIPAGTGHRFVAGRRGVRALSLFAPRMDPKKPDVEPVAEPVGGRVATGGRKR